MFLPLSRKLTEYVFSSCNNLNVWRNLLEFDQEFEIFTGLKLTSERLQPSSFTVEAVVGGAAAVPNDSTTDRESVNKEDYPRANSENGDDSGDPKMVRICDKLIEVFMVDKPNPVDWRRLLAFSKEWDNIRPHFFERCQERADKEDDPGMKHKLLRLGRKLKEVTFIDF